MGMKPRAAWGELATHVIVGSDEASAMALGGRLEVEGVALHGAEEVLDFARPRLHDAWGSSSGAFYIAGSGRDPLFAFTGGRWEHVSMSLPTGAAPTRVNRLGGVAGARPIDDELYCLSDAPGMNADARGQLCWRRGGSWQELVLPPGRPWALASGHAAAVYVSIGGSAPSLLRFRGGVMEQLDGPPQLPAHRGLGLCAMTDGSLLVCFAPPGSPESEVWRHSDGQWARLPGEPGVTGFATGWVDIVEWRGTAYLASDGGVFEVGASGRVERGSEFRAMHLWSVGDALICRGWRNGVAAHEINRGDGWLPFVIPEPGIVRGGRGKLAILPPRREVPRRRVRMTKPRTTMVAATAPTVSEYCQRWLKPRVFDGRSEPRATTLALVDELRAHAGVEVSPQLATYLRLYGEREPGSSVGEISLWRFGDVAPPSPAPTAVELAQSVFYQEPSTIAALTGTIAIGADHGGQVYFVEVAPASSEVFLYDPGQGALSFLADSLDSFFFLNDLAQQWTDFARAHDVDFEDIEEGDVDTTQPAVGAITEGLSSLEGRVNLDEDSEVSSEFHELLPALTSVRPTAASSSVVGRLFARAHWLVMALGDVYIEVADAQSFDFDRDMSDPELAGLAATSVYWLWHMFLFDDERLAGFADRLAQDSSALVRGTAALMVELSASSPDEEYANSVRLRALVHEARHAG